MKFILSSIFLVLASCTNEKTSNSMLCSALFCNSNGAEEILEILQSDSNYKDTLFFPLQLIIENEIDKDIDVIKKNIKQINILFEPAKLQFYVKPTIIYKNSDYTIDDFVKNKRIKDQFVANFSGKVLNLVFVKPAKQYNGFTTTLTHSFSRYLEDDPSVNTIFIASKLKYPVATMAHELGHFFGLQHTFGADAAPFSTNEKSDGTNCSIAGDFICDTPVDNNISFKSCNDGASQNFMSYASGNCKKSFTAQQYLLMHRFANRFRKNLTKK